MRSRWMTVGCVLAACAYHGPPDPAIDADPNAPDAAVVDADTTPTCPTGYLAVSSSASRYRFESSQVDWLAAELDCEDDAIGDNLPSHLVVLDDVVEVGLVIGGLTGTANTNDQWLGLTDLAEDQTWRYVTTQATVFTGSPSGNDYNRDCVRLKNTTEVEARSCGETNRFVCECDGLAADPARYPNPPDGLNN